MSNQKQILEKVVDLAKGLGASGADVILDSASSLTFKAAAKKLEEYKVSSSQVAGVRIVKDNRVGLSYSQSLDDDSLKYMVEQAVANSQFSKVDEDEVISVKNSQLECIINEETEEIDIDQKVAMSLALESQVLDKADIVKSAPYNSFSEGTSDRYILNSEGTFCKHSSKYYSCFTSALLEKEGKNSMYWSVMTARKFKDLSVERVVDESFNIASDLLEATPIQTGKYSVVFETSTFSQLFGCFDGMFSAKAAVYGLNPFKEKVGKQVATTSLNISDSPLSQKGMSYSLFDDEGSARKDVSLIKDGVLNTFLHNTVTAKKLNSENTSSASRGVGSGLGVNSTNTFISIGETEESQLYNGDVFEIIKLDGLHSGTDFISGDFSCGASGYLVRNGQRVQAVKGVTISGNFYKLLMDIEAMGNVEHANEYNTFFAPLIRFNQLTVAGA